eukprot:5702609-Lingulodinium_polyedra.AAC.1
MPAIGPPRRVRHLLLCFVRADAVEVGGIQTGPELLVLSPGESALPKGHAPHVVIPLAAGV